MDEQKVRHRIKFDNSFDAGPGTWEVGKRGGVRTPLVRCPECGAYFLVKRTWIDDKTGESSWTIRCPHCKKFKAYAQFDKWHEKVIESEVQEAAERKRELEQQDRFGFRRFP